MRLFDLTISQLGPKGDGIHEGARGRVYVERALPGDRVKAEVEYDEMGVARGHIVQIVEPSPHRQAAPCPHYEGCGNCTLQHVNESFYRSWKTEVVKDALKRQGVHALSWLDPIFIGNQNRRRATFSAYRSGDGITVGYYRRRSTQLTDVESCLVADPKLLALRGLLKPFLVRLLLPGTSVDVFLQLAGDSVDMVLTGLIGRQGEPDDSVSAIIEELRENSSITRLGWRPHPEETFIEPLFDKGPVIAEFGPLKVNLPPLAFLQPTLDGERALTNAVMEALPAQGRFADLFSGSGTFAGPMLTRGSVDAFEAVPEAVYALKKAAGSLPLRAFERDLFSHPLLRSEIDRYDAVVFDPPRGGAPEQAVEIGGSKAPLLVGISCNPATFARDARLLNEGGYSLKSIRIVDQFVYSHHVEVVGVFIPKKKKKKPKAETSA